MRAASQHPLEGDAFERERFEGYVSTNIRAEWRRLVTKMYGHMPTWAQRQKPGRKPHMKGSNV